MSESKPSLKENLKKLGLSILLVFIAGGIAGLFSMNSSEVNSALIQPPFAPPSWLFAPVWITLYILITIAFFLVYRKGTENEKVRSALMYFIYQLVFNVLWTLLFFTLQLRIAALVDIFILLIYILITTIKFFKVSKAAGILMIPYLLWVTFAAILNFAIVILNG